MLLVSWWGAWQLKHGGIPSRPLAWALVAMTFSGWIATISGWYVTEIGRQPWLVQGVLRTADAVSTMPAPMIGLTLALYLTVYAVLLTAFISTLFYMARRQAS